MSEIFKLPITQTYHHEDIETLIQSVQDDHRKKPSQGASSSSNVHSANPPAFMGDVSKTQ
jgi:hypothetical protein